MWKRALKPAPTKPMPRRRRGVLFTLRRMYRDPGVVRRTGRRVEERTVATLSLTIENLRPFIIIKGLDG